MRNETKLDALAPQDGEMRDLSLGSFRFIAALLLGLAVLTIAGVL